MPGSNGFERERARQATIKAHSEVLDSRLNKLCADYGLDPAPRRKALEEGKPVRFAKRLPGGELETLHVVHPEDMP